MMLKLFAFMLFMLSGLSFSWSKPMFNPKQPDEDTPKMEIYLLIGQSNMAGRAEIEQQDKDTLKNVFLLTGIDGKEWEPAANPLNKYSTIRKNIKMLKLIP